MILFGGLGKNNIALSPENSLDLNDYTWYIPKVTGKFLSSRAYHKTVVIGKYMVVTFGKDCLK